jgi:hypothetical protein
MTTVSDMKHEHLNENLKKIIDLQNECNTLIDEMFDPKTEGSDNWLDMFKTEMYDLQDDLNQNKRRILKAIK